RLREAWARERIRTQGRTMKSNTRIALLAMTAVGALSLGAAALAQQAGRPATPPSVTMGGPTPPRDFTENANAAALKAGLAAQAAADAQQAAMGYRPQSVQNGVQIQ